LHLISDKLALPIIQGETLGVLRAGELRKTLRSRFGAREAERANELWRSAPASPGAPMPNIDQGRCTSGVWECPRSIPASRRDFPQEKSTEQQLLGPIGGWCG
jgi:hypothetical protein